MISNTITLNPSEIQDIVSETSQKYKKVQEFLTSISNRKGAMLSYYQVVFQDSAGKFWATSFMTNKNVFSTSGECVEMKAHVVYRRTDHVGNVRLKEKEL